MEEITVRISELPGADPLSGIELIPLVQNGVTKVRAVQSLVLEGGLQDHLDSPDPHPQYAFRVQNNLSATTDPTVNDDITQGYEPTSRWVNTVTEEFFICVTNTAGNANWQQQTLTLDELGSAALANVGAGNGLDADLLDGQHGSYYRDAGNLNTGTLPSARFTDTSHGSRSGGTLHSAATTSTNGFMSATDKVKLNSIESGAEVNTVDSVNSKTGNVVLTTDDISEDGSPQNLWFTQERARTSISVSGDLSYNSSTGIISFNESYSTPNQLLGAIISVDGTGSGLDADLLDGFHASSFQRPLITESTGYSKSVPNLDWNDVTEPGFYNQSGAANETPYKGTPWQHTIALIHNPQWQWQLAKGFNDNAPISYRTKSSNVWGSWVQIWSESNDGAGSGLDADLLDGQHGSYYRDASNLNTGTVPDARLPNTISSDITGNAATATQLETARTINGTSFNGTANIVTSSWGTARNLTIGSTGKSVNGSSNISWSLSEIGVNNGTLTLATSGIATGSQTWTANQGSNATFTVNVPGTNLGQSRNATSYTVTSSTGSNTALAAATASLAGVMTASDKSKLNSYPSLNSVATDYLKGDGSWGPVPGAVEVGVNSDGTWIRFENGVQICLSRQAPADNNSAGTVYNLPAPFVSTSYHITVNTDGMASGSLTQSFVTECARVSSTQYRIKTCIHTTNSTGNIVNQPIFMIAIGFWK